EHSKLSAICCKRARHDKQRRIASTDSSRPSVFGFRTCSIPFSIPVKLFCFRLRRRGNQRRLDCEAVQRGGIGHHVIGEQRVFCAGKCCADKVSSQTRPHRTGKKLYLRILPIEGALPHPANVAERQHQ